MGLFSRRQPGPAEPASASTSALGLDRATEDETPVPEEVRPLGTFGRDLSPAHRARLETALAELDADGLDLTDLAAISAAHDAASVAWHSASARRRDEPPIERYAVAIGEHLARTTDLRWATVVDPLGTDLGLIAPDDDRAVIPGNLVGSRWLNGTIGWIPGIVGHLARLRNPDR